MQETTEIMLHTLYVQLRAEYFRDRCIKVYAGGEDVYVLHNNKNNRNPTKPFNNKQIVWQ